MTKIIKEGRTYIWDFVCRYCGCEFQTDSKDEDIHTNIIDSDSLLMDYGIEPPKDIYYDLNGCCVKKTQKVVETAFMDCPWCHKRCASIHCHEDVKDYDVHDS